MRRRPAPVTAKHGVRDENVGVQLRLAGARCAMPKSRPDEPCRFDGALAGVPAAGEGGVALKVAKGVGHGDVMSRPHGPGNSLRPEPVEDTHGLGRKEGEIEPGDPTGTQRPGCNEGDSRRSVRAPREASQARRR